MLKLKVKTETKDKKLAWTKEWPDRSGFYWMKIVWQDGLTHLMLAESVIAGNGGFEIYTTHIPVYFKESFERYFYGPIRPPED